MPAQEERSIAEQRAFEYGERISVSQTPSTAPVDLPSPLVSALGVVVAGAVFVHTLLSGHAPLGAGAEIARLATDVIGDKESAQRWLSEPCPALDNKTPIAMIRERNGYERVRTLLMRIEYGVLA